MQKISLKTGGEVLSLTWFNLYFYHSLLCMLVVQDASLSPEHSATFTTFVFAALSYLSPGPFSVFLPSTLFLSSFLTTSSDDASCYA